MEKTHPLEDDDDDQRHDRSHHRDRLQQHQPPAAEYAEDSSNDRHRHDPLERSAFQYGLSAPQDRPNDASTARPSASERLYLFRFQSLDSAEPLSQPSLYQDNNPDSPGLKRPPLPPAFQNGCQDVWQWNMMDKSHEVRLCGDRFSTAFFHPNWSNGTAGVRGTRPVNRGVHYWEIRVSSRLFGTSMMFGVATRQARLHADSFLNLLGEDAQSWGLSHKGLAWHGGRSTAFCSPFAENVAVTVGMVYDGTQGTLTYYKDGEYLGVAFTGLNSVSEDLFPAVCSTAAKTEMTLGATKRAFLSLQDRCRDSIVKKLVTVRRVGCVPKLPLPRVLRHYVWEEAQAVVAAL